MATRAQIDANRKNALKSTGPKSPEGKGRARMNRLTHGLRAERGALPTEDPAEFGAFMDAWFDDWKPTTTARAELVEQAAVAAWRRKRCVRAEAERIRERVDTAVADARRREMARLDRLVEKLADEPESAVLALRSTRAGARRLAGLWRALAEASRQPAGWNDYHGHHLRLFHLLGGTPGDDELRRVFDLSWPLHLSNDPEMADPDLEEFRPATAEQAAAASAWIHQLTLSEAAALEELAAALPDDTLAVARLAEAEALASRPEDALLLRYEAQRVREFHRALGDLVALTKSAADLVDDAETPVPTEARHPKLPQTENRRGARPVRPGPAPKKPTQPLAAK